VRRETSYHHRLFGHLWSCVARRSEAEDTIRTSMDILESLEVRWFLPPDSKTSAALDAWFKSTPEEGTRIDHYLATGRDDLGFKARIAADQPTKVETKYLLGSLGVVELAPEISGELQRWTKLSLELDDPKLRRDGTWLSVTKKRRLRKYAVALMPTAGATEVAIKDRPGVGCGVELTKLEYTTNAKDCVEWTFGLEAFGPKTQLLDVLQAVCRAITSESTLPELRAEWTASYASWLLPRMGS